MAGRHIKTESPAAPDNRPLPKPYVWGGHPRVKRKPMLAHWMIPVSVLFCAILLQGGLHF